jgi:Uma2 family endonuclease
LSWEALAFQPRYRRIRVLSGDLVKVPHYAAAGIAEVWIVDLERGLLLVYRGPQGKSYKECLMLKRGDSVSAQAFPEITFDVSEILGPKKKR